MPLFRWKSSDKRLQKSSFTLSLPSLGSSQEGPFSNGSGSVDSGSLSDVSISDIPDNPLSVAEANFNPSAPFRTKSRLSKTLDEVLKDHGALAYFIQYLDALEAKHLIKFWLEAESFHASAWSHITSRSQSLNNESSSGPSKKLTSLNELLVYSHVFQSSTEDTDVDSTVGEEELKELSRSETPNGMSPQIQRRLCVEDVESTGSVRVQSVEAQQTLPSPSSSSSISKPNETSIVVSSVTCIPTSTASTSTDTTSLHGISDVNSVCKVYEQRNPPESSSLSESITTISTREDRIPVEVPIQGTDVLRKEATISRNVMTSEKLLKGIERDAVHIYKKYIAQDASHPIGVSEELRNEIIASICREDGQVDPESFVSAQNFVVDKMEKEYFPNFLRSSYHCKHQIDVLTSGNVFLADILYNDSALFYFMEFMEQEGLRHLVDFLLIADNFRNHLLSQEGGGDLVQAQNDAMVLYDRFFSLQATNPLGFSDPIRFEIEQNICQEGGPHPDCFRKPVMIIMQYLEKTYLPQFLCSQLYFKYLSEHINTIQTDITTQDRKRRSGSDSSSSEHSTAAHTLNTLLAMDSKQPGVTHRKIPKNIGGENMRIDMGQFNPDSLWRRRLAGKLQLAHVNQYGKITMDFEPEPDRKSGSRLSQAVKKLVNWDEDKSQEEMAWQVAEMIVKDVCSVTLGDAENVENPNSSSSTIEDTVPNSSNAT